MKFRPGFAHGRIARRHWVVAFASFILSFSTFNLAPHSETAEREIASNAPGARNPATREETYPRVRLEPGQPIELHWEPGKIAQLEASPASLSVAYGRMEILQNSCGERRIGQICELDSNRSDLAYRLKWKEHPTKQGSPVLYAYEVDLDWGSSQTFWHPRVVPPSEIRFRCDRWDWIPGRRGEPTEPVLIHELQVQRDTTDSVSIHAGSTLYFDSEVSGLARLGPPIRSTGSLTTSIPIPADRSAPLTTLSFWFRDRETGARCQVVGQVSSRRDTRYYFFENSTYLAQRMLFDGRDPLFADVHLGWRQVMAPRRSFQPFWRGYRLGGATIASLLQSVEQFSEGRASQDPRNAFDLDGATP